MADDSFIREVDEEIRSERLRSLWDRFGYYLIGGAVLVVLVVAGYRSWVYYDRIQSAAAGDEFMSALRLVDDEQVDDALTRLEEISESGTSTYAGLARMRRASELVLQDKIDDAITIYDDVISDSSVDENVRDAARLRAGFLVVDSGEISDVEDRMSYFMADESLYRGLAHEAIALAHYKSGDLEKSMELFIEIRDEADFPRGTKSRARRMLEVLAMSGIIEPEEEPEEEESEEGEEGEESEDGEESEESEEESSDDSDSESDESESGSDEG